MYTLRYFLAVFLVVSLPPLFLYWLLIHPLIAFWRRQGPTKTYAIVLTLVFLAMAAIFSIRHSLLVVDWGTNYWLISLGIICLVIAGLMRRALGKYLSIKAMLGLPEIAPENHPRQLITEGIYARMRHPRYVQMVIALIGYALIANYLAAYVVVVLWIPGVYVIALLEEDELRNRFGAAYDDYARKVPRFVPNQGMLNCRHRKVR